MKLGIDVRTLNMGLLMNRLAALKTTISVRSGGAYTQDTSLSQIHLDTTWNEAQLDLWLYNSTGIDYIGTFVREELALNSPRIEPVVA